MSQANWINLRLIILSIPFIMHVTIILEIWDVNSSVKQSGLCFKISIYVRYLLSENIILFMMKDACISAKLGGVSYLVWL